MAVPQHCSSVAEGLLAAPRPSETIMVMAPGVVSSVRYRYHVALRVLFQDAPVLCKCRLMQGAGLVSVEHWDQHRTVTVPPFFGRQYCVIHVLGLILSCVWAALGLVSWGDA